MFIHKVIQALQDQSIEYALIGGYAVALHGVIRGTVDIDLVVALEQDELGKVVAVMAGLGLVSRLPVTADDIFNYREEYIRNRNLHAWSFVNPDNPLEVVDVLITHDVRDFDTVTKRVGSMELTLVSIPQLIDLKKESARPQDLSDIQALEKLL